MYKKAWCTCKIVVLVIKPIAFLTFLLLSPSLDLKVSYILTYWYFKKTIWKSELKCEEREYSKVNKGIHHWFWYTLNEQAEGGKTLSLCSLLHRGSFGLSHNPPQWTRRRNIWQSPKKICKGGYSLWACSHSKLWENMQMRFKRSLLVCVTSHNIPKNESQLPCRLTKPTPKECLSLECGWWKWYRIFPW